MIDCVQGIREVVPITAIQHDDFKGILKCYLALYLDYIEVMVISEEY
jgi:transposase